MVKTISLERAIAEKATSAQMFVIAEWHDERIDALNQGRRPKDYEHRLAHHRSLAKAMRKLAKAIDDAGAALEAAA